MTGRAAASRPTTAALIDLDALQHNLDVLRRNAAPARFMIVVKADAYGHGAVPVAHAAVAAGVRDIGALDVPNALALRASGIDEATHVLAWLHTPRQDFTRAVDAGVELTASTVAELDRIATSRSSRTPVVQFKVDTGLHRNGSAVAAWPALMARAARLRDEGLITVKGVWTHIAEASEEEDTKAMRRFDAAIETAAHEGVRFAVRHLAASSAAFRRQDARYDMVRVGGHSWGIPSFDGITPGEMGLVPVMTLVTGVDAVVRRGSRLVAHLPVGYSDGLPREARGLVHVAIRGRRYLLTEEIRAADTLVPVSADVRAGDLAYLFGTGEHGEETVRQWGDQIGTLGDEIVTRLAPALPRLYLGRAARRLPPGFATLP
ncbi:MAG TPA: alanine racemase [Microbacteriaceae bacterium]|nr:alanine racemase [Microbacteriaceae bacterium]